MALDKDRWGAAVAAAVQSIGVVAGTPVTTTQLELMWKAIKNEDKTEVNTNADIDLDLGDLVVPGSSGLLSTSPGNPVGGTGLNNAVVLTEKIK